jgi:hypothetical protein
MIADGQTFKKQRICLDGASFQNCTFEECELIYSGLMPTVLQNNTMRDCRWQFAGPAQNTMGFLTMLYGGGAKDLIEATFTSIRNGSIIAPQQQPVGEPTPQTTKT